MYNDIIFNIPCESGWNAPREFWLNHYTFHPKYTYNQKSGEGTDKTSGRA